jgi:hypothetical protein
MPFSLTNIRDDQEDLGSNLNGPPDLDFRSATRGARA